MEIKPQRTTDTRKQARNSLLEVLLVSAKLGLTSFGGPVAHLGYFHNEYIHKRKWMDDKSYADLVALCQFLPGPASSQVGISIGIIRAGLLGGVVAWLGFTLPSVLALLAFAFLMKGADFSNAGWLHGLNLVAVAVVAQAVLTMGKKLTPDKKRATLAIIATAVALLWQTAFTQLVLIVAAGLLGSWMYRTSGDGEFNRIQVSISRKLAIASMLLFGGLLIILPILRIYTSTGWLPLLDSFYRSGSLVFGGGHIVMPLLEHEVVPPGWVKQQDFMTGYAAAQAVPGPLFTFASYLGALVSGIRGAALATVAIFLPAFLLVIGALPFWNLLRKSPRMQGALTGINASVVGLLLAALYDPLWTTGVTAPVDFTLVALLFVLLEFWKSPPWLVVLTGLIGGIVIHTWA